MAVRREALEEDVGRSRDRVGDDGRGHGSCGEHPSGGMRRRRSLATRGAEQRERRRMQVLHWIRIAEVNGDQEEECAGARVVKMQR